MVDSNWGYQVADTVQLAYLTRAGIIESRHHGLACLTGPDGKLIQEHGNSRKLIYPRSAVKPLQALAMRRAGLKLSGAELAMSSASHQGTPEHTQIVLSILEGAGLKEADLQCPVAWPGNLKARSAAPSETRAAFNCSGKHAAFLAACVQNGWDTKTYLQLDHPLQKLIVEVIEEFSGENIPHSTFDGCGAPLHLMSLQGLARAVGKFAQEETEIRDAMLSNPWVVDDHGASDTMVMEKGMLAKIGAEGVFVIGLSSGHGVAVKVADGSMRPAGLAAIKMLLNHGLLDKKVYDELFEKLTVASYGGEQVVGQLEVAF
ncbi:MAG: asparaginase [Rhodoluna sp.]